MPDAPLLPPQMTPHLDQGVTNLLNFKFVKFWRNFQGERDNDLRHDHQVLSLLQSRPCLNLSHLSSHLNFPSNHSRGSAGTWRTLNQEDPLWGWTEAVRRFPVPLNLKHAVFLGNSGGQTNRASKMSYKLRPFSFPPKWLPISKAGSFVRKTKEGKKLKPKRRLKIPKSKFNLFKFLSSYLNARHHFAKKSLVMDLSKDIYTEILSEGWEGWENDENIFEKNFILRPKKDNGFGAGWDFSHRRKNYPKIWNSWVSRNICSPISAPKVHPSARSYCSELPNVWPN